jgi:hypothetical protein
LDRVPDCLWALILNLWPDTNFSGPSPTERNRCTIGLVVVMLFQFLGGALAPSIGQNIFTSQLLKGLEGVQGKKIDTAAVLANGAKDFRAVVSHEQVDEVIDVSMLL